MSVGRLETFHEKLFAMKFSLPLELEAWRGQFESTQRPFIKLLPEAFGETTPWQSKIGGLPYLPKGMDFPATQEGKELFFLAQINFAEVPHLDPFPREGILQFYINDDEYFGSDPLHPSSGHNFRVLFFEKTAQDTTLLEQEFAWLRTYGELPIVPGPAFPLRFDLRHEIVPLSDYHFVKLLGEDFFAPFGERQWDIMDAYSKMHNAGGHKLGGYAFFTQQDPRYRFGDALGSDWELLFQLDSDPAIGCAWGDMGTGNFFIKTDDLAARDFSKVLYHWDCY